MKFCFTSFSFPFFCMTDYLYLCLFCKPDHLLPIYIWFEQINWTWLLFGLYARGQKHCKNIFYKDSMHTQVYCISYWKLKHKFIKMKKKKDKMWTSVQSWTEKWTKVYNVEQNNEQECTKLNRKMNKSVQSWTLITSSVSFADHDHMGRSKTQPI